MLALVLGTLSPFSRGFFRSFSKMELSVTVGTQDHTFLNFLHSPYILIVFDVVTDFAVFFGGIGVVKV